MYEDMHRFNKSDASHAVEPHFAWFLFYYAHHE